MPPECSSGSCGCGGAGAGTGADIDRRTFLKWSGAGVSLAAMPLMAGPLAWGEAPANPIPLDKNLAESWLHALTGRSAPTVYAGWEQLRFIGMPVGGIGSGTVYLGGDGRLWCWDIFNEHHMGVVPNTVVRDAEGPGLAGGNLNEIEGANYVAPPEQTSPWNLEHGFELRVRQDAGAAPGVHKLDRTGFNDVRFTAQYPIGRVTYRDPGTPLEVALEAFSPFIPLDTARSSYPAAILRYRIRNTGSQPLEVELLGWLANPVLGRNGSEAGARRVNRTFATDNAAGVAFFAEPLPLPPAPRDEVLFTDFESHTWGPWTAEGAAFAGGPFPLDALAPYQQVSGAQGRHFVNSHNTRVTDGVTNADDLTGSLTSPPFTVVRRYIKLRMGGGSRIDALRIEVLVDGEPIARAGGADSNDLREVAMNVAAYEGRQAQLRIVDEAAGGWGNIQADAIVFTDAPLAQSPVEDRPDHGSMALLLIQPGAAATARWQPEAPFDVEPEAHDERFAGPLRGAVRSQMHLEPGAEAEVVCVLAWHFPNAQIPGFPGEPPRRWYAARFADARAAALDVAAQLEELTRLTRLWHDSWYDGSLPHWVLERTLATACALQTNTVYRFADGRFWAWEGVGCCPGTCAHVWHYAQAVARLFPDLERDLRERTDYGIAFREDDGLIRFRAEFNDRDATDGQAGIILRTYREHLMSPDNAFLERVWPRCRKALEFLIAQDARDGAPDGIPAGEQHNTLDAEWFGKVPVLASLYLAALRAGEVMGRAVGDREFAERCAAIYALGRKNIERLFDPACGYFVQEENPEHLDAIGVGKGCYIDQVMGQWWAFQLGLGRLYDEGMIRNALQRLWDYNFCPDMGALRASIAEPRLRGRSYALAGDAGLVMCTWPKGGRRADWERHWQYGYFNECMTGFEYEAAGHMIWEGTPELIEHGLAVVRAIHDRYHGRLRNPYNEIECSDHYARAMASYGAFLGLCGFEYDGPRGHIGFAPRLRPDDFRAAFTAAEGWGQLVQKRSGREQECSIDLRYGALNLSSLAVDVPPEWRIRHCAVAPGTFSAGKPCFSQEASRVQIVFPEMLRLTAGQRLAVRLES